jgi:hypothetical protein
MEHTQISIKQRVKTCRNEIKKLGVKAARFYFVLKYPEYNSQNRLDNLWFGKIEDEDFTIKLEAFTEFKKVQFKTPKNK